GKDMPSLKNRIVDWVKPLFALNTNGGYYSGEDISFYDRARKAGYPALVDTRPRLFHVGRDRYGLEATQIMVPRYRELTFPTQEEKGKPVNAHHLPETRQDSAIEAPPAAADNVSYELEPGLYRVQIPDDKRPNWYAFLVGKPVELCGSEPGDWVIFRVL